MLKKLLEQKIVLDYMDAFVYIVDIVPAEVAGTGRTEIADTDRIEVAGTDRTVVADIVHNKVVDGKS